MGGPLPLPAERDEAFLPEAYRDSPPELLVTLTVDGVAVRAPKGALVIRVAEQLGIEIPRFCDHPLLDPVGACRQCLVEVEGQRKPLASCTTTVADGMVVRTQATSETAEKVQRGTIELLLVNHPLDCPVCDKGGECPLQNQAMSAGAGESRFRDRKRTYPKPVPISANILLDRERCVLCARCTRFSQQIAGDPFIELFDRGGLEKVSIYEDEPFSSYFSGNTVQICPVGALTSQAYRFRARPFDLVSRPGVCEHCASGCAIRTDVRRGTVMRRLAGQDPAVNEEWNCDKGRFAFAYRTETDRIRRPMVRDEHGQLVETSWPAAFERAAEGLQEARDRGGVGVLVGGRSTLEDAYAYAKFARVAVWTNDIDMRARPHSEEEVEFLASHVVGTSPQAGGVSYESLDGAPVVLLAGLEPEEESPIIFLRLRKAARSSRTAVYGIAPFATDGLRRMNGTLLPVAPGDESALLRSLATGSGAAHTADTAGEAGAAGEAGTAEQAVAELLRNPGSIILVGERLAEADGALTAALALAQATGAKLAWVPRRAGERGAVEAGALPSLLPGGRPVGDPAARADLSWYWSSADIPDQPGRDSSAIVAAAAAGELSALVVGGVDPDDMPDPAAMQEALRRSGFVVSLEVRHSSVTDAADVVFPVAAVAEKAGTFLNWEGRPRPFALALEGQDGVTLSDLRVLDALALELDVDLGLPDVESARREIAGVGVWDGPRAAPPSREPSPGDRPTAGQALLATWPLLLDEGRLQDGEPHLAGTRRTAVARLSAATAADVGVADGATVVVSTDAGEVALPVQLATMPDGVVWLPTNSAGSQVRRSLAARNGTAVTLRAAAGGAP